MADNMKIVPIRPAIARLDSLQERIVARATDLMRGLGEDGRMALSKHDVRWLMAFMDTRKIATAETHRDFLALEADLRKRHGLAVRAVSVATDGIVRADRDPCTGTRQAPWHAKLRRVMP